MIGGRYVAVIALGSFIGAALGITAIATPAWYEFHAARHVTVGLFQQCEVSHGLDDTARCEAVPYPSTFCGHDKFAYQMRHGWTAALAILSCVLSIACGLVGIVDYARETKFHPKSMMALSILSGWLMTAALSIFSHTYDGWVFCDFSYCRYVEHYLGQTHPCVAGYGYSFVIAASALGFHLLVSLACGLYVRFLRSGYLDEEGNMMAKVLVLKQSFVEKMRRERSVQQQQQQDATTAAAALTVRKRLPRDSSSPDRRDGAAAGDTGRSSAPPAWIFSPQQQRIGNSNGAPAPTPSGSTAGRGARANGSHRQRNQHHQERDFDGAHELPGALATSIEGDSENRRVEVQPADVGPAPLPMRIGNDGSWVLDPSTGLYWSEKERLYLKATGRQFYFDPATSQFFDVARGTWGPDPPRDD